MAENTETRKLLEDTFKNIGQSKTTAEAETTRLKDASQAAYRQTQLENQKAQNQYAQDVATSQTSALDAIRRSNASAIASGANAGLAAANELSAILGLQQETAKQAADVANTSIDAAAQLNTQLNDNAVKGAQTAAELNAALGANEAELAKAIASQTAAEADVATAEASAAATAEATKQQEEANKNAQKDAKMKTYVDALEGLTNNWTEGAGYTRLASYYDPYTDKTIDSSKKGNMGKTEVGILTSQLATDLRAAYASGDDEKIKNITEKIDKFLDSIEIEQSPNCLAPGTRITLADGSYKLVEDITNEDVLLAWDIFEGVWTAAPVLFVEHDKKDLHDIIHLEFEEDVTLDIIDDHGIFDTTLMKYVYIKSLEDAKKYIGHTFFYSKPEWWFIKSLKLLKASIISKNITTHSPCTANHMCVVANDLLTMPGNTEPFTNVCRVTNQFRYCEQDLTYLKHTIGTFSEKDFEGILDPYIFHAFQGPLLKIKIAKGETSMEEINKLIDRYSKYFV